MMSLVKNKDVIKYFDTDRTASVKVKVEWPAIDVNSNPYNKYIASVDPYKNDAGPDNQIQVLITKVKVECTCATQAAIKVCRANCDSTENNKIHYE